MAVGMALGAALMVPAAAHAADRAFELVSPAGADPTSMKFLQADPDGAWVHYKVDGPNGPDPLGVAGDGGWPDFYGAQRGASGWQSSWLNPVCPVVGKVVIGTACEYSNQEDLEFRGAEAGRVLAIAQLSYSSEDTTDAPGTYDAYVFDAVNGATLVSGGPSGTADSVSRLETFASPDLSTVAFAHFGSLVPSDLDFEEDLYVVRDGTLVRATAVPGCDVGCGGGTSPNMQYFRNPVSDDGERVFFSTDRAIDPGDGDAVRDVYVNEPGGTTLLSPGVTGGAEALFAQATPDGEFAYWTTDAQVVPADDTDTAVDVYVTEVDTGDVELVSRGSADVPADFVTAAGDGSRAFFTTTEAVAGSGAPDDGLPKMYAASGATVSYVASFTAFEGLLDITTSFGAAVAVAEDGSAIVFEAVSALVAEDGNAVADLYRWTPGGGLELLTDRPAGEDGAPIVFKALTPETTIRESRWGPGITADASEAYFDTRASLVDADEDGGRTDVYAWTEDGGIELVSPRGAADDENSYRSNTPDGRDVVFESAETISGWDTDAGEIDIYVARVGGGLPEPAPSSSGAVGAPAAGGGPAPTPPAPGPATTVTGPVAPVPLQPPVDQPGTGSGPSSEGSLEVDGRTLDANRRRVVAELTAPAAGTARVTLRARMARGKARRVVARGSKRFAEAGSRKVRLRLNRAGRRALRSGSMRAVLVARFTAADGTVSRARARVTVDTGEARRHG